MRKRAYLGRPCFWPKFFVANVKLVKFGFDIARAFGFPHVPYYASRNPASKNIGVSF